MSTHRSRMDRDAAEHLLRRGSAAADPLTTLLAAAAAPPRPDELAGEQAVLAAFRAAAHLGPVPQPRRRSMIKVALAKLITLKVAGAALAATAAGGVAVAATTGNLPGVGPGSDRPAAHASANPSADKADEQRGKGSPSPSLVGLCHAFQAGAGDNPGKALENPAFRALISAAGDKDKVADFCTDLLASAAPDKEPTAHPTRPAGQSSHAPTARPTAPTDGKPTARPTAPPTR